MQLSKRTEYGLRAVVAIARQGPGQFVQSRDLRSRRTCRTSSWSRSCWYCGGVISGEEGGQRGVSAVAAGDQGSGVGGGPHAGGDCRAAGQRTADDGGHSEGGNLWRLCRYDKLSCSDHHILTSAKNGVGGRVGRVRYYYGVSTVWVGSGFRRNMGAKCPLLGCSRTGWESRALGEAGGTLGEHAGGGVKSSGRAIPRTGPWPRWLRCVRPSPEPGGGFRHASSRPRGIRRPGRRA